MGSKDVFLKAEAPPEPQNSQKENSERPLTQSWVEVGSGKGSEEKDSRSAAANSQSLKKTANGRSTYARDFDEATQQSILSKWAYGQKRADERDQMCRHLAPGQFQGQDVDGDGYCQFYSIAGALLANGYTQQGEGKTGEEVKQQLVKWIRKNSSVVEAYVFPPDSIKKF